MAPVAVAEKSSICQTSLPPEPAFQTRANADSRQKHMGGFLHALNRFFDRLTRRLSVKKRPLAIKDMTDHQLADIGLRPRGDYYARARHSHPHWMI
ncbi:DUF1127 domain-containing protein [Thalassospira mesophila]|uniref:DUF1127 domain-containing protein n=1 Tax=Thalassospira mesophila TaxID=1293891 RepID=A0A1Y2KXW7_9PROT|nr:DUF1127 domain-containing protein [Thalassospira mesophila]OSQ37222.1 hypothetical protein TMES_15555 [Thalassospira mesophila]